MSLPVELMELIGMKPENEAQAEEMRLLKEARHAEYDRNAAIDAARRKRGNQLTKQGKSNAEIIAVLNEEF